jgi:hypothetical protein
VEEECWTFLEEYSILEPYLLDMHALELDMCHLELECSTCRPILYRVRLLVMD